MRPVIKILKSKYVWMTVYVLSVGLTFWYVRSVLKTGTIDVSAQQEEKKVADVKSVKVSLAVEMPKSTISYDAKLKNTDTVLDLLNTLRDTTNFTYQKTAYIDRVELDFINGIYPQGGYKWKIFFNGEDITQKFQDMYLQNKDLYTIKLVKE